MRITITAKLHQGHTSAPKMDQLAEASRGRGYTERSRKKQKHARVAEMQIRTLQHKFRQRRTENKREKL